MRTELVRVVFVAAVSSWCLDSAAAPSPQGKVKLSGAGMNLPAADGYVDADKLPTGSDTTQMPRTEFAGTPIPVVNPTIGNGAGGVGMLAIRLRPEDTVSPPSLLGAGGLYTDSGSWAFGLFGNLFLSCRRRVPAAERSSSDPLCFNTFARLGEGAVIRRSSSTR